VAERTTLEAVFFAALERPAGPERRAYLEQACGEDQQLREKVGRMLAAHPRAGGFLDHPVEMAAEIAAAAWAAEAAPSGTVGADASAGVSPRDHLKEFLAPPQRPDAVGRLGHYEILEVVGQGSMGIVLRAFDDKLHRVVAIKVLAPQLAASASARQRFVREARAAAAVTHDHVIPIYAVEDAGPLPYLVMQFIDGPTLEAKLARLGPFPVTEVLRIGVQIAAGLGAAHAQGLVHRDVKPGNILLDNGVERVKITDFGLARAADDATLTSPGVIAGTPVYMSPEQAEGAKVDHRSDLFSLGTVLYELCTGKAPFGADTARVILRRVCDEAPRPIREVNPDVPDWLAAIVTRLHDKNPAHRYQSAAEVAGVLGRHLAGLQMEPVVRTKSAAPRRRKKRAIPIVALLLVGVAVGLAAWQLTRPRGEADASGQVPAPEPTPGPPRKRLTYEEMANRPGPLDALRREANEVPANAPPEVVAVLGEFPRFQFPTGAATHWMGQTADGKLLAVPSGGSVILYNARTGELVRTIVVGGNRGAFRPAFSPDGKRLAAGMVFGEVRTWNAETGQEEFTLKGHTATVWSVAFDAEGKRLVSADEVGAAWTERFSCWTRPRACGVTSSAARTFSRAWPSARTARPWPR
jgi:serine/threonine protein kinase